MSAEWDLPAADLLLLEQACAAADRCADLRRECAGQPAMITGRLGQSLPNPLFAEARAERRSLVAMMAALGLLVDAAEDAPGAQLAPVVPLRGVQ